MKKILALVLTMALVFTTMGTTVAFAAENPTANESALALATVQFTETGNMIGGYDVSLGTHYVPSSATFNFKISGNTSMYVNVTAVNPLGQTVTIFSHIKCDGTNHTVTLNNLVPGNYIFTLWWSAGTSAGQTKPYKFTGSW